MLVAVEPLLWASGFGFGLLVATVTAPVGVSGAVFLLPVQLSVLHVPNPAVTPTNLLFNVVAAPGALLRYWRHGRTDRRLVRLLLAGTLPGVAVGAVLRVTVLADPRSFRLVVAVLLLPLGLWLCASRRRPGEGRPVDGRVVVALGLVAGTVGGIYGIGGGSLVAPVLVGLGAASAAVAPAALASTWVTSVAGCLVFAVLARFGEGDIAPDWALGIACGLGGLVGGYLGARLQPHLPERALRALLGVLAVALALLYLAQALR